MSYFALTGFPSCRSQNFPPYPLMSAWSGQVRVDIQLISWNAFCYSQLRRLTGSNLPTFFLTYLLTFFLTYLLTFFLTYLPIFFLTFFLTYLLTFFLLYLLTYLLTFFLTYLLTCFLTYLLTYQNQNLTSTASQKKQLCKLYFYLTPRSKSNIHDNFVRVKCHRPQCIGPPRQKAVKSKDAKRL